MLELKHISEIVKACYPETREEKLRLWHDIKPVRFGNNVAWTIAQDYQLADYQIPEDATYMVVLRVECYVTSTTITAPDYGFHAPPPPGTAHWIYSDVLANQVQDLTSTVPTFLLCDVDELLLARGGNHLYLLGSLNANPSVDERFVHTVVYGYLLGSIIADYIGSGETLVFGA